MSEVNSGTSLGALLVGYTVSTMFYGVSGAQCYFFLRRDIQNVTKFKILVCVLWFLETINFVLVTGSAFHYTVRGHNTRGVLDYPIWQIIAQIIPTFLISGIVQYVWIMRIWTLSRNKWRTVIASGMIGVVLLDWALAIYWLSIHIPELRWADLHKDWLTMLALGLITFNDIIISVILCLTLHSSKTGIKSTDSFITVLMAYTLNTGLITCIISVVALILIVTEPFVFYYTAVYFVFTRVYVNSLLAMLNWRRGKLKAGRRRKVQEPTFELTTVPWGSSTRPLFDDSTSDPIELQ
ncbi:hypothetical protein HYDPIDRAFT_106265 [Hydnomerulius pinastri MD-312]|nr:hypothetical protein HYDPIDRAFT_106265 [Hydnomerulius pinastri MD-312]